MEQAQTIVKVDTTIERLETQAEKWKQDEERMEQRKEEYKVWRMEKHGEIIGKTIYELEMKWMKTKVDMNWELEETKEKLKRYFGETSTKIAWVALIAFGLYIPAEIKGNVLLAPSPEIVFVKDTVKTNDIETNDVETTLLTNKKTEVVLPTTADVEPYVEYLKSQETKVVLPTTATKQK